MKLSVIVPGRQEPLMQKTIDTLLQVSGLEGDIEVFAVLDGCWMKPPTGDSRMKVVQLPSSRGMRAAINAGLHLAKGEFVAKIDAHCSFDQNFGKVMVENCAENWLTIPRRYSLDDVHWTVIDKPYRDHHYLRYPVPPPMSPHHWYYDGGAEIEDTMSFQGSCWLANRKYFMDHVGFLDDRENTYGSFAAEQLEVGLKYWLNDGEVKINKKTWYAHLFKMPRHYVTGEYGKKANFNGGWEWATRHWLNDEEPGMQREFAWLLEKFAPVPTWPEDRSLWNPE